ncbi:MAG: hypothetical protein ABH824_07440 [Nanoarchaeota archaeon]
MKKNNFYLLLGMIILVSMFSLADIDTGFGCFSDQDCYDYLNGADYFCNPVSFTCFKVEENLTAQSQPSTNSFSTNVTVKSTSSKDIEDLKTKIAVLEKNIVEIKDVVSAIDLDQLSVANDFYVLQEVVNGLQEDITAVQQQLNGVSNQFGSQINSISTGLAGLQENLNSTQTELSKVEDTLSKRQALTRSLIIFFIFVAVAATGVVYYIKRKGKTISPEVVNYISDHIKQGKKFPQIKENLLKAGWAEKDIIWAYQETIKHNYRRFKKDSLKKKEFRGSEKVSSNLISISSDKTKVISIVVISILLVLGLLFLIRGITTGKAISFGKLVGGEVNGTVGEVIYTVECTPPHILTPAGDDCCLDGNSNNICDNIENLITGTEKVLDACTSNYQCSSDNYCINGHCRTLSSLYEGKGDCSKLCDIYALKISTSDGETYNLKPKKGSYTAVGALEWKILQMPSHCKGELPIVPINIITKETGKIINEEVVALKQGEKSKVLTHPNLPSVAFTLKADRIFYSCPE